MRKLKLTILLLVSFLLLPGCNSVSDRFQDIFSDKHVAEKTALDKTDINEFQLNDIFLPVEKGEATNDQGYLGLEQVYAVDGDTIKAVAKKSELEMFGIDTSDMSGTGNYVSVTVRYLLTDAPESVHPSRKVQPFSKEAANRNNELVNSGNVRIQFDKGNKVDKFGRLLGYAFVADVMVQEVLLKEGYARIAYVDQNTTHLKILQAAEKTAKAQKLKVWSIPGYVTDKGFNDK